MRHVLAGSPQRFGWYPHILVITLPPLAVTAKWPSETGEVYAHQENQSGASQDALGALESHHAS